MKCLCCKKKITERDHLLNNGLCRKCTNYNLGLINHIDNKEIRFMLMLISCDYQLRLLGRKPAIDISEKFGLKK